MLLSFSNFSTSQRASMPFKILLLLSKDLARMTAKEKDTEAQLAVLIRKARELDQQVAAASILLRFFLSLSLSPLHLLTSQHAPAVVAPSAEEANPLDLFASVCCVQTAVLPLAVAEVDPLADIEAQAPVALTLLVEARQILDAIEPEEDMTEEDHNDLFSE
ncbi:hypothetical protein BDR26DRAFT_923050 [Obelidium mucronatum]|nr:hypothetical protein BDR26DRAFT_923050 [Obelidium mucronatum]